MPVPLVFTLDGRIAAPARLRAHARRLSPGQTHSEQTALLVFHSPRALKQNEPKRLDPMMPLHELSAISRKSIVRPKPCRTVTPGRDTRSGRWARRALGRQTFDVGPHRAAVDQHIVEFQPGLCHHAFQIGL